MYCWFMTSSMFARMIRVSPAMALRLTPEATALCVVAGGLPTAVNVFIMAAEYKRDEAIAGQMIFWTTALSAVTIPIILYLIRAAG